MRVSKAILLRVEDNFNLDRGVAELNLQECYEMGIIFSYSSRLAWYIQLLKALRIKFQKFAAHSHKDACINETFIPT